MIKDLLYIILSEYQNLSYLDTLGALGGSPSPVGPDFLPICAAFSSILSLKLFCGVSPLFGVPDGFHDALEGVPPGLSGEDWTGDPGSIFLI